MKHLKSAVVLFFVWISLISGQDKIQGSYTYTYGDKESLVEARQSCKDLAVRDAIESYYVFVQSSTGVENYQTKEDIIQSIAAGYLKDLRIVEQKEEGRTITMVVEASVIPEEVEQLVQKLATQDKSKTEAPAATSVQGDVTVEEKKHPFLEALDHYENQMDSVEGIWESGNRDKIMVSLEKAQKYLEINKPSQTDGFWASVYQCENLRINVIIDLLHVDRFENQNRKYLVKKRVSEMNQNVDVLKTNVNRLIAFSQLTEKQKSIQDRTVNRCRRTINRARIRTAEFKKQSSR